MHPTPFLGHPPEVSSLQVIVAGAMVLLEFINSIRSVISNCHLEQ